MQSLFATPVSATLTVLLFLVIFASFVIMWIGIVSYRHLVLSRWDFLSSLEHNGRRRRSRPVGVLGWIYILVTIGLAVGAVALAVWQPHIA